MMVDRVLRHLLTVAILGLAALALVPAEVRAHAGHEHAARTKPVTEAPTAELLAATAIPSFHVGCTSAGQLPPAASIDQATDNAANAGQPVCNGGCCAPGWMGCCPLGMPSMNDIQPPSGRRLQRAILAVAGDGIDPGALPEPPRR